MPKAKKKSKEDLSMSNVPAAVKRQAAKADKMLQKAAAGQDPYDDGKQTDDPDLVATDPDPNQDPPVEPVDPEPDPQPAATPEPVVSQGERFEPGQAPSAIDPADPGKDWQQSYRVLDGKYKAEMGRLLTIIENQDKMLKQFEKTLEAVQSGVQPAQAQPAQSSNITKVDPTLFESYGDEMVQFANTVNTVIDENTRLKQQIATQPAATSPGFDEIKTQVTNLTGELHMTKKDRYYGDLDRLVPDWETINVTQPWAQFLDRTDPIYGMSYRQMMDVSHQNLDARKVAAIFLKYKSEAGIQTPNPGQQQTVQTDPLEAEAVPAPAGGATNPDESQRQQDVVTVEMLKEAKNKVVQGQMTEDDFNKIHNKFMRQLKAAQGKGKR